MVAGSFSLLHMHGLFCKIDSLERAMQDGLTIRLDTASSNARIRLVNLPPVRPYSIKNPLSAACLYEVIAGIEVE